MTPKSQSASTRAGVQDFAGRVGWDVTMSLDGFVAGSGDGPELPLGKNGNQLFDWYFKGDTPSTYDASFKLSPTDAKLFDQGVKTVGAIVAGRRTYDISRGWDGSFFIPVPFFVLTHKAPVEVPKGTTTFTFVTDGIESAIKQAKVAAGDKMVGLMGASVARQCIEIGLLDELHIHIVHVLLGDGVRLFDHLGTYLVELERTRVIESSYVTHLNFNVVK
jgi:dihydrofolate reductase